MTQPSPTPLSRSTTAFPERGYDLVVIGSSAGGIEALTTLVAGLPVDFAASLVIAQHLAPDQVSHLGEILARHTPLPVVWVRQQEALQPGVIYVVPADHDVEISDHAVILRPHAEGRSTPSVNRLFRSAAHAHGERLIGVILTGAGSDGASGAREVKAAGGMVIIENPATAAFASMPQSLARSLVDLVVDLPQIGSLLGELVAGVYLPSPVEADTLLPTLLEQVRAHSGIDFSAYKPPTIVRRLQRRLAITRMETLEAYLQYLPDHPEEYHELTASFLINVTDFFRDPELFATLRDEILPPMIAQARAQGRELRCWSAGCATGEEAYSLAMLLADLLENELGDNREQTPVRIFATDVDADAITFARRGVYPASALAALPAELIRRAFTPLDGAYEITPSIRNLVIFGQHDLGVRAPFPHLDLVLCRNVLIYFTPELQRRALQLFTFALRDGGYLALGKAETPTPFAAYFAPVSVPLKLYRRHGTRVVVPPPQLTTHQQLTTPPPNVRRQPFVPPTSLPPVRRSATASEYVGALLLNSTVGVVVVDRHYDIQAINRAAQQLLGLFRAALGEDLIHLVTADLARPLRTVIDAAFARPLPEGEAGESLESPQSLESVVSLTVGAPRSLQVTAIVPPSEPGASAADAVLLEIIDVTAQVTAQAHQQAAADVLRTQQAADALDARAACAALTPTERRARSRQQPSLQSSQQHRAWDTERLRLQEEITRLTTQLAQGTSINRILRAANDDYASVNLTINGLNEDLVVRNEELQASPEEIKTLNEEMQATNEELETLNEEMEATVEELHATNENLVVRTTEVQRLAVLREEQRQASAAKAAELTAILRSMSDALLVVNSAGETLFTNAAYDALFGGRPFDQVTNHIAENESGHPLPPAETPLQRTMGGESFRMVFTRPAPDGGHQWFEATGEPVRMDDVALGGVLTIRDITDRSLRRLQDEFLALATHELRSPLTAIQAIAQLVARHWEADEARHEVRHEERSAVRIAAMLASLLRQTGRLQRLINDLTDVSRLQHRKLRLEIQPVDVQEVIVHAIEAVAVVSPTPVIVLEAQGSATILADAMRLEQILTNLLTNANKYAADSPQILVRLRQVSGEVARGEVARGEVAVGEVEIQVQDSGPGIDPALLPALFQRFYQVSPDAATARSGLGLGLFLTRELVVAQGGRIDVSSQLGQGTTFTLRFPLLSPS